MFNFPFDITDILDFLTWSRQSSKEEAIDTTEETTSSPSDGTGLLDLPAELRNLIYHFAVVNEKPIKIIQDEWRGEAEAPKQPALAMTCKQIRDEVLPVFYGANTFVYDPAGDIVQSCQRVTESWIQACEPYVNFIRSVGVTAHLEQAGSYYESGEERYYGWTEIECYITATLIEGQEWVELWLGGELEDQCICSMEQRRWDSSPEDKWSPSSFIEYAIRQCREDLVHRLRGRKRACSICGCRRGLKDESGLFFIVSEARNGSYREGIESLMED